MKTHQFLAIALYLFFTFVSCSSDEEPQSITKVEPNCGKLVKFSSTRDFCLDMELPVSEFSVMYPEGMTQVLPTEGTLNINYNHFMILDSLGFQTETIELGGSTIPKNVPYKKMLYKQILVQAKQVALERGFTLLEEFSGKSTFEGKEYNMFRAIGEVNSIYYQLSGRYFILGLIIEPNRNNRNGVFVTMMANQNSTIENFEDFATKGCISKVWQSIHFDNKE